MLIVNGMALRNGRERLRKAVALLVAGGALTGGVAFWAVSQVRPALAGLYTQEVPPVGTETVYGLPLAWENAPLFAQWYDGITLSAEEAKAFSAALAPLRAPCCDDNPLAGCCCERGGLICNLVRTTRGLGKHLVRQGYPPEAVTQAMDQWLRFAHGDYYVARALVAMGKDPTAYGLFRPEHGACYRGLCTAPLQEGGCGGMGKEVVVSRPKG
ncbi:MAG: hypothetical protein N2320_03385 [Candidatus Bipolaricaulota bacterium]|nr:hypothetical protein [Candidatus Bipolaricaulota bacterium]